MRCMWWRMLFDSDIPTYTQTKELDYLQDLGRIIDSLEDNSPL